MAANTQPIFIINPIVTSCLVTSASTRDGSGTGLVQLFTGGTNGSRIEKITCCIAGTGTSAANAVRLYITGSGGTTPRLFREQLIGAASPQTGPALGGIATFTFAGGVGLGPNNEIWVGQASGDATNNQGHWTCEGGHF